MKIREFFINFFDRVKDGISRYFITFVCSVILFGALSYDILFRHVTDETIAPLCLSCVLVGLFSILLKSIQEQFTEKLSNLIQILVNAVVAVVGFVLIKINYESNYMLMAYIGILIALLSGCTYAFYVVYLDKSGLQSIPPFKLNFWINFLSSIEIIIIALCTKQLTFALEPIAWGASIFYAVLCCIGCIAFQEGTKYVGAQSASLLSAFEPATSVVLGIAIFHEQLTVASAIGIVSILISVILLSVEKKPKNNEY